MRNSILRTIYHAFVCRFYKMSSYRGGWMLTASYIDDYKRHYKRLFEVVSAHLHGWSYNDWKICSIDKQNCNKYLNTRDYNSLHPLNGVYSTYIDDKLILKYILSGTAASMYMPDYYFHIMENGNIVPLMDLNKSKLYFGFEDVAVLLEEKKALAFKLLKGSLGKGFYKATYTNGFYTLNEESFTREQFIAKISTLRNYLVTEFLFPHAEFAKLCSNSAGCLRFVVGRRLDGSLIDIYSFVRFGTSSSKFVENYNAGGLLALIKDGKYKGGNMLDLDKCINVVVENHPDNNVKIEGEIPYWSEVVEAAHTIAEIMPELSYMGIDFCITSENKIKVIEINSLSSLDALQIDKSIYDTSSGVFFEERLKKYNEQ